MDMKYGSAGLYPEKIRIIILFIFFISLCSPLYPDLGSFKEDIEEKEKENSEKVEKVEKAPRNDADEDDGFIGLMGTLLRDLFMDNMDVHYKQYPYYPGGYIRRSRYVYSDEIYGLTKAMDKNYYFTASLSGFYMFDMGGGPWFSFSGNFYKFVGPYIDTFMVMDGKDTLNGIRVGLQFSLLQYNGFQAIFYAQWQGWYGILQRSGENLGFDFRIYPVKPLTLRFKLGFQIFDQFDLGEIEAQIGFMIKAWEIQAGYRWWNSGDRYFDFTQGWSGPYAGVRFYF